MDNTPEEGLAAKRARDMIERLLRPREELIAEKQAMTQQLAQGLGQDQLTSPISLVDPDMHVSLTDAPNEKQRTFIEAVRKNINLQKELFRLRAEHRGAASSMIDRSSALANAEKSLLEEQLECNRLEKERRKLEALKKYYGELNRQPAAGPDFLDPKIMFKDCVFFPELPRELVEGFTKDQDSPDQEVKELVSQLRKATLRQKLVLEHDRRQLEELKAKSPIDPKHLPPETQVAVLNAVKDSLVNWIENMLSQAGESESEEATDSPSKQNQNEEFDHDAQLAEIEKEYKRHIELRKQIIASMSQLRKLKETPRLAQNKPEEPALEAPLPARTESQIYLLTPYLEKLQALSRDQKWLVQEKAHINSTITRQQQEANKTLRRSMQESKLLSNHAPPTPVNSQSGLSFAKAIRRSSVTEQIQPWLFATDSAKIATLEVVAEAVDKGQVSIEDAVQALDQVSMLQNKGPLQMSDNGETTSPEQAMKLEVGENSGVSTERTEKKVTKDPRKSIWSALDGNLGLINE